MSESHRARAKFARASVRALLRVGLGSKKSTSHGEPSVTQRFDFMEPELNR
jgi:hypothetical protein